MSKQFDFKSLDAVIECDWPVTVRTPIDGGKVAVTEFTARFRLIEKKDLEGLMQDQESDELAVLKAGILGFGGETAKTETWSDDMLRQLLNRPFVRLALVEAYKAFAEGVAVKN